MNRFMLVGRASGCTVALLLLLPLTGSAQNGNNGSSKFVPLRDAARAPAPTRALVTVAFERVSLESAIQEIARQAGLGISYKPELDQLGRSVSLHATGTPAAQALLDVLRGSNLELLVAEHGSTLLLRARPAVQAPACAVGGIVREAETGGPLAAVDVMLRGTRLRTLTATDGSFCLPRVPDGNYTLDAAMLGYGPAQVDNVTVPGEAAQRLAILLAPAAIALTNVVVTPGHFGIALETLNRPETLSREQIETLPQLAEDIYRTVNRLPGIVSNEMTAKFYVRGGDDKSVLVLLDGLELHEPYHLKDFDGSLSILDVAAIGGVDLTTGGFSAEYGNRLTGVFDLHTTNQIYSQPHTTLGISLSNIRMMSQGSFANGNGLWLFSGRRGYLDILLRLIGEGDNLDPRYYDVLGKVVYQFSPQHRLSARALRAGDSAHLLDDDDVGTVDSRYGSTYGWLTWQAEWNERLRTTTQLSTGALDWDRLANDHEDQFAYDVRDVRNFDYVGLKQDWLASLSDRVALKWGLETRRSTTNYDYFKRIDREHVEDGERLWATDSSSAALSPAATELGAYFAPRLRPWAPLTVEAGLRWDRQSHTDETQISPRVNLALALGRRTTLRAAWGRYAQPHALYQLQVQDAETTFSLAERAQQLVAGLEHQFNGGLNARIEAYRRNETDLRPRYRNLKSQIEAVPETEDDRVLIAPERARAQGIELFVQRNTARTSWSASYALARAYDEVDGLKQNRPLDQRHTLYLDYSLAPSPAWRLSWSWQYHSGWPITPSTFRPELLSNGSTYFVREFGQPYSVRLPAYHRMDLRVTRNFTMKRGRLSVFLDVFNLYDRDNPQAYNYSIEYRPGVFRVNRAIEPLLPRLPTLGASWEF